jgi:PLP dependent protein
MNHHNIENLLAIRQRMAQASQRSGRKPDATTLVAVSKTMPVERILPILAAGQRVFGENRVQEAQNKWPALRETWPGIELHLIGSLQSNKADDAVATFDCIEVVDRLSLAQALAKAMARQNRRVPCYIQVNIGAEDQKGGCSLAELPALIDGCVSLGLPVIGLMCLPPADENPAPYFALLHKLATRHSLARCSMGMSGDFELAIQLGATDVRVGSALFGARPAQEPA